VIISVSQTRVPIVFARTVPQTQSTLTKTAGTFSLESLKNVFVSPNVQTGDGLFYDREQKKWISKTPEEPVITVIDGGTY